MIDPIQSFAFILAIFTVLASLGLAADRFGVDSREPFADDHRR
jgi:hypothetical protein